MLFISKGTVPCFFFPDFPGFYKKSESKNLGLDLVNQNTRFLFNFSLGVLTHFVVMHT